MRERPILFSAPMVRAILAGTKTQTRRVFKVNGQPITSPEESIQQWDDGSFHYESANALSGPYSCPYGQPGDLLWVRETWATQRGRLPGDGVTFYRADGERPGKQRAFSYAEREPRWRPSIHMPRWASRIDLEITGVRVERLQDISEADAIAEGVEPNWCGPLETGPNGTGTEGWLGDSWIHYGRSEDDDPAYSARESYQSLWELINGDGSWDANPWVWVVEFSRVKP